MDFSGENILIILLVGLVAGLLPGTIVERTGVGLIRDIAIGIGGIFVASLLTLAWRDAATFNLSPSKPAENVSTDLGPRYEPVVLPLARLRPLLKPIVYRSLEEICEALADATRSNDLPAHFFIRLLYQESNFRLAAISSAGALGIAQFTPETATDRGLDNPFDPLQAIPASAARLRKDHHRVAGRDVDSGSSGQPRREASASGALPTGCWPARLERTGRDPVATAEPAGA